jgi:hypothetical protein
MSFEKLLCVQDQLDLARAQDKVRVLPRRPHLAVQSNGCCIRGERQLCRRGNHAATTVRCMPGPTVTPKLDNGLTSDVARHEAIGIGLYDEHDLLLTTLGDAKDDVSDLYCIQATTLACHR